MNALARRLVTVAAARTRTALLRLRPFWQRLAAWSTARVGRLRAWVPQHRRAATATGVGAAAALMLLFSGVIGGSPERQVQRLSLSGRELFASLRADHAGVERASRVDETDVRGSRTNLIVVPDAVWNDLSVAQRNSLGTWLNELGGRWEIRVGRASDDGERVLEAAAAITSREWNQQIR